MAPCNEDWFESLSAWHDGEVTREDARRVEEHLLACSRCRRDAERLALVGEALRADADALVVPERVRAAATSRLGAAPRKLRWAWPAVAAAALMLGGWLALGSRALPASVAEEIVQRHFGGFARSQPCDVESSDPSQVAAWFSEHAGYSVHVPVAADSELLGGRMCHLCGKPTAAVMLRRAGVPVTVFVPPPGSEAARQAERLAAEGSGCTRGPLGSSICACTGPQPMLAVAESEPSRVSAALSASLP